MNSNLAQNAEDQQLLKNIAKDCRHSFNTLYERYWESAYISAYKRLKDEDQAKDIVQEIFTYIWFKRMTIQIDNLPAYLHIAVRNRVFKYMGKQKSFHPFFAILETLPSVSMQADSDVLTKEFFKVYENLVNSLSPKKQQIFRLRYEEDFTTKEIAHQLGLSRKTVQNQLTRAVIYLRTSLFFLTLFLNLLIKE